MKILDSAIRLQYQREHSEQELQRKLQQRGFAADEIDATIIELQAKNLQSDQRFAEAYTRARSRRGYGAVRIQQELKQRGVSDDNISDAIQACEVNWFDLLESVRSKKFGSDMPTDYKDKAKQMNFLIYRGFAKEQVQEVFS